MVNRVLGLFLHEQILWRWRLFFKDQFGSNFSCADCKSWVIIGEGTINDFLVKKIVIGKKLIHASSVVLFQNTFFYFLLLFIFFKKNINMVIPTNLERDVKDYGLRVNVFFPWLPQLSEPYYFLAQNLIVINSFISLTKIRK